MSEYQVVLWTSSQAARSGSRPTIHPGFQFLSDPASIAIVFAAAIMTVFKNNTCPLEPFFMTTSPKQDQSTTVTELKQLVQRFVSERNWERFHTPKNLASSIAIETAELMEHFQWLTPEETLELRGKVPPDSPIAEEISDVLAYTLALANTLGVDLSDSLHRKMLKNAQKYPAQPPSNRSDYAT